MMQESTWRRAVQLSGFCHECRLEFPVYLGRSLPFASQTTSARKLPGLNCEFGQLPRTSLPHAIAASLHLFALFGSLHEHYVLEHGGQQDVWLWGGVKTLGEERFSSVDVAGKDNVRWIGKDRGMQSKSSTFLEGSIDLDNIFPTSRWIGWRDQLQIPWSYISTHSPRRPQRYIVIHNRG